MIVELYGVLQQAAQAKALELPSQPGETVAAFLARLAQAVPLLAPHLERCACAVGDELIPRGETLPAYATVAVLPPVSGG